jgi:hypothetical protein
VTATSNWFSQTVLTLRIFEYSRIFAVGKAHVSDVARMADPLVLGLVRSSFVQRSTNCGSCLHTRKQPTWRQNSHIPRLQKTLEADIKARLSRLRHCRKSGRPMRLVDARRRVQLLQRASAAHPPVIHPPSKRLAHNSKGRRNSKDSLQMHSQIDLKTQKEAS